MGAISGYNAAAAVTDDDVFLGNDGSTTKKFPATAIKAYVSDTYAAAAPTTGAHLVAEKVWNTAPTADVIGWICTVAGTPGTWMTIGAGGGVTTPATTYIYPEDYGAIGDGVANDFTALQTALYALTADKTLWIRSGKVYNHNAKLWWGTTGSIIGPGRIHATVETNSAFQMGGTDQNLGNVTFSSVNTGRGTSYDEHKVLLYQAVRAHFTGTIVSSARGAAFLLDACTNCTFDDIVVTGSRADGFHMATSNSGVAACTGIRVNNPHISNVGDDGIAVVTGNPDNGVPTWIPSSDIIVTNPVIRNTAARGLVVVGGTNIQYLNVDVDGCAGSGLYMAAESTPATGFNTTNTSNVTVTVAQIANANNNAALDYGDIFFYCGINRSVSTVSITGYAGGNGQITSSDSISNFHIGGRAEDSTGSVSATVSNMVISPNDGKPLKFEGTNTSIGLSNVSY